MYYITVLTLDSTSATSNSTMPKPDPVSVEELNTALAHTKSGTAVGYDNIAPEFLKHLGPLARCWLIKFLSHILEVRRTPRLAPSKSHRHPETWERP